MLVLIRMGTSMASPYKPLLILWKHFLGYLVYKIFLWPKSWRESLYIYLLSFPRFWTLSIERFDFYFDLFWMTWHWKPAIEGFSVSSSARGYAILNLQKYRSLVVESPRIHEVGWGVHPAPVKFSTVSAENVTTFLALKSRTAWRLNFFTVKRGFDANFIKKLE